MAFVRGEDAQKAFDVANSLGMKCFLQGGGRVFVKNLPYSTTEQQLMDFFKPHCKVMSVSFMRNQEQKLNGRAIVEVDSPKGALNCSGKNLEGRPIIVEPSNQGAGPQRRGQGGRPGSGAATRGRLPTPGAPC